MQRVLNVIAVVGFLFSVYNFIIDFSRNRKNLTIDISNVFIEDDRIICNMHIINNSRAPITVSKLKIYNEKSDVIIGTLRCSLLDNRRHKNDVTSRREVWYSDTFPVKVEGLGFHSGLFVSLPMNTTFEENTTYNILVHTNRGIVKSKFDFKEFTAYLELSEYQAPSLLLLNS